MPGRSQLPDQEDIELGLEGIRDFGRHGDTATRQSQDDNVGSTGVFHQPPGKLSTGIVSIDVSFVAFDHVRRKFLSDASAPESGTRGPS